MEPRWKRRFQRVRDYKPIEELLDHYGYPVYVSGGREQQFPCDLHGDGTDGTPSARIYPDTNSWYCISEDSEVLTSDGWVLFRDLTENHTLLDGSDSWRKPNLVWCNGEQETLFLETKEGFSVCCTPEHDIFIPGGASKKAQDLREGDRVAILLPSKPRFSERLSLPFSVSDLNSQRSNHPCYNKLSLPSVWTEELGILLGYIVGDGWIVDRKTGPYVGLVSSLQDGDCARSAFEVLRVFANGGGSETVKRGKTKCNGHFYDEETLRFTLGSRGVVDFFKRLGIDKQYPVNKRRIPHTLWKAPLCAVKGFLSGLFAAVGSVFRHKNGKYENTRISLYSVSIPLLKDVQKLLLQFGIFSRVYRSAKDRSCPYLQIGSQHSVSLFRDRIGISNRRKQRILDIPLKIRKPQSSYAVISSIKKSGFKKVMDLSMPVEHSFCVGGFRVHNCFACSEVRDTVDTVRIKEGLSFMDAVKFLENLYNLPPLPWEDGDSEYTEQEKPEDVVAKIFADKGVTFDQASQNLESVLSTLVIERTLSQKKILTLWEVFDQIKWYVEKELWTEKQGIQSMLKMKYRILENLKNV